MRAFLVAAAIALPPLAMGKASASTHAVGSRDAALVHGSYDDAPAGG